jgi:hypothetical protein
LESAEVAESAEKIFPEFSASPRLRGGRFLLAEGLRKRRSRRVTGCGEENSPQRKTKERKERRNLESAGEAESAEKLFLDSLRLCVSAVKSR